MIWPKLLVFVRHGESEGNVLDANERPKYTLATHAYPLTARGKSQAKITGEYLLARFGEFDVYYNSYYTRAKETMGIMYPNAKVYEDSRLAEGQRGIWHSMTREEIQNRFPEEFLRKEREGLYHYRPFGGENWADMELRIHSFLGTLSRDYGNKKVLVVGHGHWLILFQKLMQHFSIEEAVERYKNGVFQNASVTIYEDKMVDGKPRLVLNEENIVPWKDKLA